MVPLWLLQVSEQLPRRRKDPASLLAAGKWISAPELVHIIDTAYKHAELDLQHEGVTVQTSRQRDISTHASYQIVMHQRLGCSQLPGALPAS